MALEAARGTDVTAGGVGAVGRLCRRRLGIGAAGRGGGGHGGDIGLDGPASAHPVGDVVANVLLESFVNIVVVQAEKEREEKNT